jgi:hypothetical protein
MDEEDIYGDGVNIAGRLEEIVVEAGSLRSGDSPRGFAAPNRMKSLLGHSLPIGGGRPLSVRHPIADISPRRTKHAKGHKLTFS